ncbi:NAD(P)/FAD-dependent oxidoreductase [Candidatus Thorarchaeota archaeon]|nr:MAG: NAD(P)/FAD-dependent oxidoreductase [Candidatus Thorarchaeota archaeon]
MNLDFQMQEISSNAIDVSSYDFIIAGAGAGGLLTALGLSALDKRVLVIEESNHLGGVWYGYEVDEYRVDNGLHMITRVKRGAFAEFMRENLDPPPEFVLHDGWYFRVNDKVGTIPTSIAETLCWPLTGLRGRLGLARIGAKIKTMKLAEMKEYKDFTFQEFMECQDATNQVMLDVMQSAIYMAAGVPITEASAYEALRTLKDTDKEYSKLESAKRLVFGSDEYDEGYVIGGMKGLVDRVKDAINGDYMLNSRVDRISETSDGALALTIDNQEIIHPRVISNIPLWSMSSIVESDNYEANELFNRWDSMQITKGVTLWLGIEKVVIGDRKSRVLVRPEPNRWLISLSSFDPTCAPEGKELIALAMMRDESISLEEQVEQMKGNGMEEYYPEILENIEMEHLQTSYATRAALIPGQTDLDRPGPRTPLRGLYIVGTDTAGSGVGLQQAANSARNVIEALREDNIA